MPMVTSVAPITPHMAASMVEAMIVLIASPPRRPPRILYTISNSSSMMPARSSMEAMKINNGIADS